MFLVNSQLTKQHKFTFSLFSYFILITTSFIEVSTYEKDQSNRFHSFFVNFNIYDINNIAKNMI